MNDTLERKPIDSQVDGVVPLASVIDAVNDVENEVARRLVIAKLKMRDPQTRWITRPGGWLDVT